MSFKDFMGRVRSLDNQMSRWIVRHFYILFFEVILVVIFIAIFVITIKVIDISVAVPRDNTVERLLLMQSVNSIIIVFLLLLNSFWMLYMFNAIIRMRGSLREINFNILKRRN